LFSPFDAPVIPAWAVQPSKEQRGASLAVPNQPNPRLISGDTSGLDRASDRDTRDSHKADSRNGHSNSRMLERA
jgi:hypothetical protein